MDAASGWRNGLDSAPQLIRFGAVVIALAVVLSGRQMLAAVRDSVQERRLETSWRRLSVLHVCSMGAFYCLTREFLERGRASGDRAWVWLIACIAAAVLSVESAALCALPSRVWRRIAFAGRLGLAAGILVASIVSIAGLFINRLWPPLAAGTFWCVQSVLTLSYPDLVCQPENLVLGTSRFTVLIAPECSGYEGLGLVLAFLSAYLWIDRRRLRFPRALMLLPIGAAAIWLTNAARIAALIAIGTSWSESIALGGFHSQAGWLAFNAICLGIVAIGGRSRYFSTDEIPPSAAAPSNPAAPFLLPFLLVIGVSMITGAFASGLDVLYPFRVVAGLAALWHFRRRYAGVSWSFSWRPIVIGAGIAGAWAFLAPTESASPAVELSRWPHAWGLFWWASRIVGYALVAPVVEELAFRGFLLRRIISADFESVAIGSFSWPSLVVSSLCFGALHGSHWFAGIVAGAGYALALYRRRSLGDAATAHATTNVMLMAFAAATGKWDLWS